MIRVGVVGAAGRMGQEVCTAVAADPATELVAEVDQGDALDLLTEAGADVVDARPPVLHQAADLFNGVFGGDAGHWFRRILDRFGSADHGFGPPPEGQPPASAYVEAVEALVRLLTPVRQGESEAEAEERLRSFLDNAVDELPRFIPG